MSDPTLFVLPCLRAVKTDNGVIVTKKLLEGAYRFAELWNGPMKCIMFPAEHVSDNLDNIEFEPGSTSSPLELCVVPYDSKKIAELLRGPAVALVGADYQLAHVSRICQQNRIACVYGTEYTLRTRWQIVRSITANPVIRARRYFWEWNLERRHRRAVRQSVGVQCNGTPTYDAYRDLCEVPLLFFDNRIDEDMLIAPELLEKRLTRLEQRQPLRLAFSGRLIPMKGADDLPKIASALRKRQVDFEMSIYGDGESSASMQHEIDRLDLGGRVKLHGVLDFATELVPAISENTDLFICPHRQGDPSCTYVETIACGVPIVGYDNEAFHGMVRIANVGRDVRLGDIETLADAIADLDRDRQSIAVMSRNARQFAADHTFQKGMRKRVDHFRECFDRSRRQAAGGKTPEPMPVSS